MRLQSSLHRRIRLVIFCPWAEGLDDAARYVQHLAEADLAGKVADPSDPDLMRMARLDCDWHGETVRALSLINAPGCELLPAKVTGLPGLITLTHTTPPSGEDWWFVTSGQHPEKLKGVAGKVFSLLKRNGFRILYYAFDEASRNMPVFTEVAPHLDVLIHDEFPLEDSGRCVLQPACLRIHRSWVANLVPFEAQFKADADARILFLGSRLGLTPHRARQIEHLKQHFGDTFVPIYDHSVPVGVRNELTRFKVGLCPEGRMFTTPGMAETHTDRPFWSGCMGMVPVSEDSIQGGRLQELQRAGLLMCYPHGDHRQLVRVCEQALAASVQIRRRIYDHYNRFETVGSVIAGAIAQFHGAAEHKGV